jgi:zinc transporter 7
MVSRRNRTLLTLSIVLGVLAWNVAAAAIKGETGVPVANLSAHEIEEQLQVRYTPIPFITIYSVYLW